MVNFFRKKRRLLSSESKVRKYARYAIGEIVLVVIGILIALFLNNWNNTRIKSNQVQALIQRLHIEIQDNDKLLQSQLKRVKELQEETKKMLSLFTEDYTLINSRLMDSLMYGLISTPIYNPYTTSLDEALNTGQVSNIKSDTLRTLLYDIPKKMKNIHNFEDEMTRDIEYNLMPYLYQEVSLRQMDEAFSSGFDIDGKSKLKHYDNRVVLSQRKFENMVDNKYFLLETLLMAYHELEVVLDKTISLTKK